MPKKEIAGRWHVKDRVIRINKKDVFVQEDRGRIDLDPLGMVFYGVEREREGGGQSSSQDRDVDGICHGRGESPVTQGWRHSNRPGI